MAFFNQAQGFIESCRWDVGVCGLVPQEEIEQCGGVLLLLTADISGEVHCRQQSTSGSLT